jgi:hypothetical protein
MLRAHFLLGDLDLTGWLIIGLIFLASLGGFAFVSIFIWAKVFRNPKASLTTIDLSGAEARG